MNRLKLLIIALFFIPLISLIPAKKPTAVTYYVAATGNDANPGTLALPWKTIAKVNSSMGLFNPGDAILFNKGDTWTASTIVIGRAGSLGNPITIGSYGTGNKPIISATNNPVITVTTANRGYWTIDGIDIRTVGTPPGATQSIGIYFNYFFPSEMGVVPNWEIKNCTLNTSILVSGPNTRIHDNVFDGTANFATALYGAICVRGPNGLKAIIENNTIRNWKDRGIWFFIGADTVIVRNNDISKIRKGGDQDGAGINNDGANVPNRGAKIYGNKIDSCGFGISHESAIGDETYNNDIDSCIVGMTLFTYAPYVSSPVNANIHNNVIKRCSFGIYNFYTSTVSYLNNTFYNCSVGLKIEDGGTATAQRFVNNIIAGPSNHPIEITSDLTGLWTQFDYNDIIPNGTTILNRNGLNRTLLQLQGMGYMTHGFSADPVFMSTIDFHLQGTSPCINKGLGVGFPFIGTAPDIGAFEFAGTVLGFDNDTLYRRPPAGKEYFLVNQNTYWYNGKKGKFLMQIVDVYGKILYSEIKQFSAGLNTGQLPYFGSGVYFVTLTDEHGKIVIVKYII